MRRKIVTDMFDISLDQFKTFFPDAPSSSLGKDFCVIDVNFSDKQQLGHPCRFDAVMVIYCISGHIKINVNLEEYELKQNMLFLNFPGNIIRINELVDSRMEDVRYLCLLMSKDFMEGLKLDANSLFTKNISALKTPSLLLTPKEQHLFDSHIKLITNLIDSGISCKEDSVRSVVSSMFYMIVDIWSAKTNVRNDSSDQRTGRNMIVFDRFIKLVSEYHTKYRNVGFYADKLSLTPKYLSRIIKDATGRSAPDWIDSYVILEAKNLLKYSKFAIKEIVYKLNFPNQSVFYKFFKARTGLTPSDYRNS